MLCSLKRYLDAFLLLSLCFHAESLLISRHAKLTDKYVSSSVVAVRVSRPARSMLSQSSQLDGPDMDDHRSSFSGAQKAFMGRKYKILSIAYAFVAVTLIIIPDRTLSKKLASKLGGAGGFGVAAGVSWLLKNALDEGRLHCQISRRLNVGLLGFSSIGLLAVPGEAAFLNTAGAAMILTVAMNAARILGIVTAYFGWSMGVETKMNRFGESTNESIRLLRPRKVARELWTGAMTTVKGLKVTKESKKRTLTYRNCALLVFLSMMSCLMEGVFLMRYYGSKLGKSFFDISLQWSGVARLFLISSIIVSLKDLADRGQSLEGTIFIKLNFMVGLWAALVYLGQSITLAGYSGKRIEMLAFSLPFFIKGLKAAKFKSDAKTTPQFHHPPSEG